MIVPSLFSGSISFVWGVEVILELWVATAAGVVLWAIGMTAGVETVSPDMAKGEKPGVELVKVMLFSFLEVHDVGSRSQESSLYR